MITKEDKFRALEIAITQDYHGSIKDAIKTADDILLWVDKSSSIDYIPIKEGGIFQCIKDVVMINGAFVYRRGNFYVSQNDGCITDDDGDQAHQWDENWTDYFVKVK